ncbi:hypothetical protein NMY22_g10396 [Coprinellus aureogranulatus]|nr:hypothetical protein NMY22_g10396 [Coprinellus aureogranulatus]
MNFLPHRNSQAFSGPPHPEPAAEEGRAKPVDESQWPESTIPLGWTINKGRAVSLYRLREKDGDFKGLRYTNTSTRVCSRDGAWRDVAMMLYNEREIERAAWRKHGGPEAFFAYLEALRKKQRKSHGSFQWPSSLDTESKRRRLAPIAPESKAASLAVEVTVMPEKDLEELLKGVKVDLIRLAQQKNLLALGYMSFLPQDALNHIAYALEKLPKYPQRTLPPAILSPGFLILRDVLAKAPLLNDEGPEYSPSRLYVFADEQLRLHFRWTNAFIDEVAVALVCVIKRHGLGPEGWQAARWMVYDTWTKSVGGFDWDTLSDSGLFWLRGRVAPSDFPSLPFCSTGLLPYLWFQYNAMLPQEP